MKKTLLTLSVAALATTAFAVPSPIPSANDLPEFTEFNKEITVPNYANRVIYKFNPETPGVLTVYFKGGDGCTFLSTSYNAEEYTIVGGNYGNGPVETPLQGYDYGYSYTLNPDTQYYISLPQANFDTASSVYFTWEETEVAAGALTSVTPAPSATGAFDYITNTQIIVEANNGISSFGKVTISYGNTTQEIEGCHLAGPSNHYLLVVAIAEIGAPNYAKIAADAGAESFTITISNLKSAGVPVESDDTNNDNIVVNNGNVTLNYKVSKAINYLESESIWPSTFYSYWEEGAAGSTATLMFDGPVKKVDSVSVTMATITPGSEGGEQVVNSYEVENVKIDGNKIIIDFSGEEYEGSNSQVTVIVQNVVGENGLPAYMGGNGNTLFKYLPFNSSVSPEEPGEQPGGDGPSAVNTIGAELKNIEIYNLNGVKVNGDVKALPAGIYIINGQKTIIK